MIDRAIAGTPGHVCYRAGDRDAPDCVRDRDGDVVLSLCRHCGRAEAGLAGPCDPDLLDACRALLDGVDHIGQLYSDDADNLGPLRARARRAIASEESRRAARDTPRARDRRGRAAYEAWARAAPRLGGGAGHLPSWGCLPEEIRELNRAIADAAVAAEAGDA